MPKKASDEPWAGLGGKKNQVKTPLPKQCSDGTPFATSSDCRPTAAPIRGCCGHIHLHSRVVSETTEKTASIQRRNAGGSPPRWSRCFSLVRWRRLRCSFADGSPHSRGLNPTGSRLFLALLRFPRDVLAILTMRFFSPVSSHALVLDTRASSKVTGLLFEERMEELVEGKGEEWKRGKAHLRALSARVLCDAKLS